MKTIKLKFTGVRPLLMHNGRLADPTDEIVKAMKLITDKGSKKMTESDHENRNALEYKGSLYWDEKLGPYIPNDNIERCIQLGAQKSRQGKDVAAVVFCTQEKMKLEYDGPRSIERLYADPRFILRKGVSVKKNRVIRVRPMFPTGWTLTCELEFDETMVNGKDIIKHAINAGSFIGIGDWRPKFGRFICEVLE